MEINGSMVTDSKFSMSHNRGSTASLTDNNDKNQHKLV